MRMPTAAAGVAAAVVVAAAAARRRGEDGVARADGDVARRHACVHMWGQAAADWVRSPWAEHAGCERPRAVAWGAGVGVCVTAGGDLVSFRAATATVARKIGAGARTVAMDGGNNVFYTDSQARLRRWAPFEGSEDAAPSEPGGELLPGRAVDRIACGTAHCLALSSDGEVFSWSTGPGGGRMGVLGRNPSPGSALSVAREDLPALVTLPGKGRAQAIACGDLHSVVVGTMGEVWTFGSNRWMQLGLPTWEKGSSHHVEPQRVQALDKMGLKASSASCGADHTLIVTQDGNIVGWGRGKEGQLGIEGNPFTSAPRILSGTTYLPAADPVAVCAGLQCSVVGVRDKVGNVSLWSLGRCPDLSTRRGIARKERATPVDAGQGKSALGAESAGIGAQPLSSGAIESVGHAVLCCQGGDGGDRVGVKRDTIEGASAEMTIAIGGAQEKGGAGAGAGAAGWGRKPVVFAVIGQDVDLGAGCAGCRAKAFLMGQREL